MGCLLVSSADRDETLLVGKVLKLGVAERPHHQSDYWRRPSCSKSRFSIECLAQPILSDGRLWPAAHGTCALALRSTGSWVLHGASGTATTLMASWPAPPSWCRRLGPAYVMGGGVQAQLSSFAAAHTDGPGADCRENRLNSEQNSLKVPKIFACGAFFRLRRRVRKGLKHPPLITLTADRACSRLWPDSRQRSERGC